MFETVSNHSDIAPSVGPLLADGSTSTMHRYNVLFFQTLFREKICQQKINAKAKNTMENPVTYCSGKTDGNTLSKTM